MNICFILVNYQNSQLSVECCDSLLAQMSDKFKLTIIIVDNNSTEENISILKNYELKHFNVHVIYSNVNNGYFPGMKLGQKKAYELGEYDYMVLSNNDIIYSMEFIETLIKKEYPSNTMVISPDIVTVDGKHQNPHFIRPVSSIRKFFYHIYYSNWYVSRVLDFILLKLGLLRRNVDKPGWDKEQIIYMGFGACLILTKSYINKVRYVDDSIFLMGEEQLLAIQVEKNGGCFYYYPLLKLKHLDSATFNKMPSRFAYDCMRKSFNLYKKYI